MRRRQISNAGSAILVALFMYYIFALGIIKLIEIIIHPEMWSLFHTIMSIIGVYLYVKHLRGQHSV